MAGVLQEFTSNTVSGNAGSITLTLAGGPSSGELLVISACINHSDVTVFGVPTGFTKIVERLGGSGSHVMAFKVSDGGEGTTYVVSADRNEKWAAGMWVFSDIPSSPFDVFKTKGPDAVDVITAGPTDAIAQADSVAVMAAGHYVTSTDWTATSPSFGGSATNAGAVDTGDEAVSGQVAGAYSHSFMTSTGTVSGTSKTFDTGSLSQRMDAIIAIFKAGTGAEPQQPVEKVFGTDFPVCQ